MLSLALSFSNQFHYTVDYHYFRHLKLKLTSDIIPTRFMFLSTNPNQLAIQLSVSPFICMLFFSHAKSKDKILYIDLTVISLYLCLMNGSKAAYLSIATALYFVLITSHRVYGSVRLLFLLATIIVFSITYPHIIAYIKTHKTLYNDIYYRAHLWNESIQLSMNSPIFGYGPGIYLTNNMLLESRGYWEAHNTIIDLLAQIGISGLALIGFFLFQVLKTIRHKPMQLCIYFSIITFSLFHFTARHPYVWFILYWLYHYENNTRIE